LSVTLYTPSQSTPYPAIAIRSRREGIGSRLATATALRITVATMSRPSAIAPGESETSAARIATKAEPQSTTVTSPAASPAASAVLAPAAVPAAIAYLLCTRTNLI
jgi:hypothetical protein